VPFERILADIREVAPDDAHVVFVSGNFNILHPGHLRLLRFAKECGNFLVVGVLDDATAGSAALLSETLRLEGAQANSWVDYAFILCRPVGEFIRVLKPHFVVKGKEHETKYNPEQESVSAHGGHLLFGSGETVFSSVDLLRHEMQTASSASVVLPPDFAARHGFSVGELRDLVHRFQGVRMVVIGDLIIDEYVDCDPVGMSQEDPSIVVTPVLQQSFIGGAGIVAAHAASLGAEVDYLAVAGRDDAGRIAEERLREYHVRAHLVEDDSRPTTIKRRYRAQGKTLLRVSYLRQHGLSADLQAALVSILRPLLEQADLLVFSDYNYGCLPQPLVDLVTKLGSERGLLMIADSQCSSQIGDVARFQGMALLTPTEREARISTHNHEDGLVVLAEALRRQAKAQNLMLKLGAEGVLVHAAVMRDDRWLTDRLPAFATGSRDSAGAGDSMLAASSLAMARGATVWQAAYVGSTAAACQVSRLGNVPIRTEELLSAFAGTA